MTTEAAALMPCAPGPSQINRAYPLLTAGQVARLLGMSEAWVRQHSNGLRRPSIPSVKLGKCVRFRLEDVLEFIRSMERCV